MDEQIYEDSDELTSPAEDGCAGEEAVESDQAQAADPELDALERLQAERDDFEHRLLRVSADYQNFARRAQQNVDIAVEQKLMDVGRGLVTVLDHFDRALGVDAQSTTAEDVMQGVSMVKSELLVTLSRYGIERVEVEVGDEFDPVRHEALMRQPSTEVDSNCITMQMQPGYMIGEKVLRPAQVGVAE